MVRRGPAAPAGGQRKGLSGQERNGGNHRDPGEQQCRWGIVRRDRRSGMQDFLAQRAIGGGQGVERRRLDRRGNMRLQAQNAWLPMHMCLNQIGLKREGQQRKQHHQPPGKGR